MFGFLKTLGICRSATSNPLRQLRLFLQLVCAKSLQPCPALWDLMDCSLPDFSVHRIFQARKLEWVAISYSRGSSQSMIQTPISCIYCISKNILYPLAPPGKACRMKHTLGSILPGEISITSDMQMISPLRQKVKWN